MAISPCTFCNGIGWKENIPCVNCNTRGVRSNQLFDSELRKYPSKDRPVSC